MFFLKSRTAQRVAETGGDLHGGECTEERSSEEQKSSVVKGVVASEIEAGSVWGAGKSGGCVRGKMEVRVV